jgi:O-antigen/teichoic acid export membrane protein
MAAWPENRLASHLTRASAVSMAVRVTGLALAFLSHLLLSRLLGAHQYGQYMIALGWAMVLVIPCRMGLDNSVLRFATVYREEGKNGDFAGLIVFSALVILLVASLIVGGMVVAKWAGAGPLEKIGWPLIAGIALLVPGLAMLGWLSALIRTANRIFASQFYEQVLRPTLLIAFLALAAATGVGTSAGQAMMLTGATVVIAMIGIGAHSWKIFAGMLTARAKLDNRREWLAVSWPLFLMAAVQELLNQLDLILLGVLSNATEAAHFAVAFRLASLVSFGLMAIGTVSGPLIASAYNRGDRGELSQIARLTARSATLFALLMSLFLAAVGRPALGLFGDGFEDAYPILLILIVGGLANSFTGTVGYFLIMTGSERSALHILTGGLIVSLVCNMILIPMLGALGAAIASTAALIGWNLGMAIYIRRKLGIDATAVGMDLARASERPK